MTPSHENTEFMRGSFRKWFGRVGARGDWYDIYREIEDAYRMPPRSYHSFHGHVAFCIRELYRLPVGIVGNIDEVELALDLHDSRIDFTRKDNELQSALFSADLCRRMGLPAPFEKHVGNHILRTDHSGMPDDPDSRLVVDIDLAILGQDGITFDGYERSVRKEYEFVPEDVYRKRRIEVLGFFLKRPSIFLTDYFRDLYEKQARKNLYRSIHKLRH